MKKKIIFLFIAIIIIIVIVSVVKTLQNKKYEYEIAEIQAYNYLKYKEDGKEGVIDRQGNIIIEAQYDEIIIPNPEVDIFVCYTNEEKNKILNSSGEELYTNYDNVDVIKLKNIISVLSYEKNVLVYEKDGLYGLLDFNGKELTKNIYDSIENLQSTEGKFLVSKNNKYGIINLNGKILVDIEYDQIQTDKYYSEEYNYTKSGFIVSNRTDEGYKYGYIDYKGKIILDVEYSEIVRITDNEEIYLIAAKNGQYGLYKKAKELIKPEYQSIIYTDNGGLIIQKNTNYGIANLEGEILAEPTYSKIESKGIYLYATSSDENTVYDINGNIIDINFNKSVYETEDENYRVVTLVNNNIMYYGIETAEGKELVRTSYKYIEYLYNDYFIAKDENEKFGIIDSTGNTIVEFEYDIIQRIKGKNMVQTLDTEDYITEIYSTNLEIVCTMENATVNNEENYLEIYNTDGERKYFDINGNEIDENSEDVQKGLLTTFPDKINDLVKVQESLTNIYYEKEDV